MAFRICIDSCCDLEPSPAPMLHMHILLGEQDITDEVNAMADNFHTYYTNMRNGTRYTTSQPTPEEFVDGWKPILEEGLDILYLGFSSALSGTIQSAMLAKSDLEKDYPERKIIVVDTLCASAGQGLLIEYVLEKQNSGASLEETAAYAESFSRRRPRSRRKDMSGTLASSRQSPRLRRKESGPAPAACAEKRARRRSRS